MNKKRPVAYAVTIVRFGLVAPWQKCVAITVANFIHAKNWSQ